jgi:AcrR family transcriptional regulator
MPKVSPEYKNQLKTRIVESASRVFRRKGFVDASMEDIAAEVGVSKGTLYLYFPSKVALLRTLQTRSRRQFLQRMDQIAPGTDLVRPMVRMFEAEVDGLPDPAIYWSLLAAASRDPELRAALNDDHRADETDLRVLLAHLEASGRIAPGRDLKALATILVAIFESAAGRYLLGGARERTRRSMDRALRAVLDVPETTRRALPRGRSPGSSTRLSRHRPARFR